MKEDRLLTLKDWIKSFWNFQEEDLEYFNILVENNISIDPEEILTKLKERMKIRKAYYQIYKYLNWKDLSCEDLIWVESKLNEIIKREEFITNLIGKLLEALSKFYNFLEDEKNLNFEKSLFFH